MGAEGTLRSMGTIGAQSQVLSILHPNGSHELNSGDLVQPNQHGWHGRTSSLQRLGLGLG